MDSTIWEKCLDNLREEISAQKFNTWIRPLQVDIKPNHLILLAPNQFVVSYINDHFLDKILITLKAIFGNNHPPTVILRIGSKLTVGEKLDKNKTTDKEH